MKTVKMVIATLVSSGLAAFTFFLIPNVDAGYYGYSSAGDNYTSGNSAYNYLNYDYNDPYYNNYYYGANSNYNYYNNWPTEANWLGDNQWFDRKSWQFQNDWFNAQYTKVNRQRCGDVNYKCPTADSTYWKGSYNNGYRSVVWNRSDRPLMRLSNYGYNNFAYANQYGSGSIINPKYARAIAIVDRSNANNAVIILNTRNYVNSGLDELTRASIVVDSNLFRELVQMIENYGSNANMSVDCRNNQLWYDTGYGARTAGMYFRGI